MLEGVETGAGFRFGETKVEDEVPGDGGTRGIVFLRCWAGDDFLTFFPPSPFPIESKMLLVVVVGVPINIE